MLRLEEFKKLLDKTFQDYNDREIYEEAVLAFGIDAQVDMLSEEMSELNKALLKIRRQKNASLQKQEVMQELEADLMKEVIDVEIMLKQIKESYFSFNNEKYDKQYNKCMSHVIDIVNIKNKEDCKDSGSDFTTLKREV